MNNELRSHVNQMINQNYDTSKKKFFQGSSEFYQEQQLCVGGK